MDKILTIIVPIYNEQELLGGCLDSLLNQTLDKAKYEIVVIDNNSTDISPRIALEKGVKVEKEMKKGYVHAIRKGIELCQTEYIAFTDADCRVPPDWASKIVAHFKSSADIVGVGGKLTFFDLPLAVDKAFQSILYFNKALPGNNMAVRREALSQIGGIDPGVNLAVDYWLTLQLRKVGVLKVDRSLRVQTSGRRVKGSFDSDIKYFINVISMELSFRPLFYDFPDVRE